MRPIEFRAQRADTGEFVYGDLVKNSWGCFIIEHFSIDNGKIVSSIQHQVIPETVGQLVYIDQRSEQRYYEGDVDKNGGVLMYNKELGLFAMHSYYSVFNKWYPLSYPIDFSRVKIIGTIHDKPDKP